jgi:hypothetical protein
MKRVFYILLLTFSFLDIIRYEETVFAESNGKIKSFEESLFEIGYKPLEEAHEDFEKHFKQKLKLPLRVPPVEFTHYFGRFTDLEGELNDTFERLFVSNKSPENFYTINVRPVKHKISFKIHFVSKSYELSNGDNADFITISGSNVLVFEKENWQYILSINKRISEMVPPEILVEIANSIEYPKVHLLK